MADVNTSVTVEAAHRLSMDAFMALYNEQPIEVVNGEVVRMIPPGFAHTLTGHTVYRSIDRFLEGPSLGMVFVEVAIVFEQDEEGGWVKGSRMPDVAFFSQEKFQAHIAEYGTDGPLRCAPDLAVEIVSPNDKYVDVLEKVADYLRYGVRLVWVLNPLARTVRIFTPDNPDGRTLDEMATLSGDAVLPGWSIEVAAIFALPEG